ncbi:MAG: hypothetical protein RSA29_15090 [Clostridium sp.]|uniref:hypothetical protein n=1 Tax=Clostridium sp. TaxID=1506 RepID=UPI00303DEA26
MYEILAVIQLILFILVIRGFIRKRGIIFLVDQGKIMFMLWTIAIILYNFKFSSLYTPTMLINIIVISISLSFFALSKYISLEERDIDNMFSDFKDGKGKYKIYSTLSNLIFIAGLAMFSINVYKYGLAILADNKIDKQSLEHFATYVVYMLVLCGEIKYILYRNYKRKLDLAVLIGAVGILFLTLNRGPIAFMIITLGIYEVFNFINIKKTLTRKQIYLTYGGFFGVLLISICFFGYVGNLRMDFVLENVYNRTLWEHYGVSEVMPSSIIWVYIYLTSPLQNVAYSLANQVLLGHSFFANLFYPFVKFGANLIGQGDALKDWIVSKGVYIPQLQNEVGLNAMTFIPESFQDGGVFGFVVYLCIYLLLAYISIKIIKQKKLSPMGKVLIYGNITSILLWSIFVNSFRIPILIMNIFLVLAVEFLLGKRESWIKPWMKKFI